MSTLRLLVNIETVWRNVGICVLLKITCVVFISGARDLNTDALNND